MWSTTSVWQGQHATDDNLTKFSSWTRLPEDTVPTPYLWGNLLPWVKESVQGINAFNIETRAGKIIEVHLRLGNDLHDIMPVGTKLIPVWEDEEAPTENFIANIKD
jgi:hypothetical protein